MRGFVTANELPDLLERLEAHWRRQGVPVLKQLAPGLPASEVETALAALGLPAPREAIIWWGWRNGLDVRPGQVIEGGGVLGPASTVPFRLDRAVQAYHENRELGLENDEWRPEWFPWVETLAGEAFMIECTEAARETSPVRKADWEAGNFDVVLAPSMTTVVSWWVEALDEGYLRYDAADRLWRKEFERIPMERRRIV